MIEFMYVMNDWWWNSCAMMYGKLCFGKLTYIHHCFYFEGFGNNMILWKPRIRGVDLMKLDVIDEYITCM